MTNYGKYFDKPEGSLQSHGFHHIATHIYLLETLPCSCLQNKIMKINQKGFQFPTKQPPDQSNLVSVIISQGFIMGLNS